MILEEDTIRDIVNLVFKIHATIKDNNNDALLAANGCQTVHGSLTRNGHRASSTNVLAKKISKYKNLRNGMSPHTSANGVQDRHQWAMMLAVQLVMRPRANSKTMSITASASTKTSLRSNQKTVFEASLHPQARAVKLLPSPKDPSLSLVRPKQNHLLPQSNLFLLAHTTRQSQMNGIKLWDCALLLHSLVCQLELQGS